jgi:hypothetical protein
MQNNENTVPCELCGTPTPMTVTKRCDRCWELEKRITADPELAKKIIAKVDGMKTKSSVDVAYWDSNVYGGNMPDAPKAFKMEIDDQRYANGHLYVDVGANEGDIDNILYATFEVNRIPGSKDDVQCVHLHFDGDNMAASFFKQGDSC